MSQNLEYPAWLRQNFAGVLANLRRWKVSILAFTVFCLILGAVIGKVTAKTTSTAQLILSPLPMRETFEPERTMWRYSLEESSLARMIAEPIQAKTASLICLGDKVFERVRERLNASGELDAPIKSLYQIKRALEFEITVEVETPYEIKYSPIVLLTATAKTPKQAQLFVNTWAEECVKAADEFQQARHDPAEAALFTEMKKIEQDLIETENEYKSFQLKNSISYLETREASLESRIRRIEEVQVKLEREIANRKGKTDALDDAQALVNRINELMEKSKATTIPPELLLPGESPQGFPGESGRTGGIMLGDFSKINAELAVSRSEMLAKQAELARVKEQLKHTYSELKKIQSDLADAKLDDKRLARNLDVLLTTYNDTAQKYQYARIAKNIDRPDLQVLSQGAAWEMPRFRRAILFGFFAGLWGFLVAAFVSVVLTAVLTPAQEG